MSVTSAFDPGTEIAGFRIEGVLGRGGMGTVYRAAHPRLQQAVALKVINPELAEDEDFRERFIREAQLASGLNHPNIIPVYDADDGNGRLYLAMRLVEGPGLDDVLAREAPLDAGRALALLAQVASALDISHTHGLVHRDVKPENVLIAPGGATEYGEHVYLTDFGISKKVGTSGPTRTGQLVGTLHYLAPELIDGKPIDGRCDQYALGCVLHRCLTGALPFERDSDAQLLMAHMRDAPPKVSATRSELPSKLDDVVARMLARTRKTAMRPAARRSRGLALRSWRRLGRRAVGSRAPRRHRVRPAASAKACSQAPLRRSSSRARWASRPSSPRGTEEPEPSRHVW